MSLNCNVNCEVGGALLNQLAPPLTSQCSRQYGVLCFKAQLCCRRKFQSVIRKTASVFISKKNTRHAVKHATTCRAAQHKCTAGIISVCSSQRHRCFILSRYTAPRRLLSPSFISIHFLLFLSLPFMSQHLPSPLHVRQQCSRCFSSSAGRSSPWHCYYLARKHKKDSIPPGKGDWPRRLDGAVFSPVSTLLSHRAKFCWIHLSSGCAADGM